MKNSKKEIFTKLKISLKFRKFQGFEKKEIFIKVLIWQKFRK